MALKGIDVSQWQGNIDWQKVKGQKHAEKQCKGN